MKIFLHLSYCGTRYHGFQIQPNARTIAGELTEASEKIFGVSVKITGCSRTDSGVHALDYYACAEFYGKYNRIPVEKLCTIYNSMLPDDIAVYEAYPTERDFNPRKAAVLKRYEYKILDGGKKDPLLCGQVTRYKRQLNVSLMDKCAKQLLGTHDFKAFCSTGSDTPTTERTIVCADIERIGELVVFTIEGNGFLYNMVRIAIGTLMYISDGKLADDAIEQAYKTLDRTTLGITAAADGLYLSKVTLDRHYAGTEYYD